MFLSCTSSSPRLLPPSRPWPILHDSFCLPKMLRAWEVVELVKALSPKCDTFSLYVKLTHLWSQCWGYETETGKISATHQVRWDKWFKKEEGRGKSRKILDISFLPLHAYTCTCVSIHMYNIYACTYKHKHTQCTVNSISEIWKVPFFEPFPWFYKV